MGLFEDIQSTVNGVKAAYEDESLVPEGFVRAHHILFLGEDAGAKADTVKKRIVRGDFTFFQAATSFSACPTRDLEGNLGTFTSLSRLTEGTLRGDSLPYDGKDTAAFDELVLSPETALNVIHKVPSQWGMHLVLITARGGTPDIKFGRTSDLVGQAAELVAGATREVPQEAGGARDESPTDTKGFGSRGGRAGKGGKSKSKKRR